MRILVVGAGAVGRSIATQLITHGHDVVIADHDPDSIKVSLVPDADWILADACSPTQLERAGARDADAIAAVTGDDKVNLVVSTPRKNQSLGFRRLLPALITQPTNGCTTKTGVSMFWPQALTDLHNLLVEDLVSVGRWMGNLSNWGRLEYVMDRNFRGCLSCWLGHRRYHCLDYSCCHCQQQSFTFECKNYLR